MAIIGIGIVAILAILVCAYLAIKVYFLSEKVSSLETASKIGGSTKPDPHYMASVFVQSKQVCSYINDQVEKGMDKFLRKPNTLSFLAENVAIRVRQIIRESAPEFKSDKTIRQSPAMQRQEVEPMSTEQKEKEVKKDEKAKEEQKPSTFPASSHVYYSSALNEKDNTFYEVDEQPSDDTFFKFFEIKNGKCEFIVFEGAYSKVLKEDSFLTGACQVVKIGNSKVVVTEKGIAELTTDNKWVVTKPAKVTFE